MPRNLSIVIPSYTGFSTLPGVLESIRKQKNLKQTEVVVIIDGSHEALENIVNRFIDEYGDKFANFIVKQFPTNRGRFMARLKGAELARNDTLIFIDDRTELAGGYLDVMRALSNQHRAIISNILEKVQTNFVSEALYHIRRSVYKNWGEDFEPYGINEVNFDKSPKGTAGLCINKQLFLNAVSACLAEGQMGASSSDDTRLLKQVVRMETLYRSPDPVLLYVPRAGWNEELSHLYKRGPMFVDYYLRPGSPYFVYLLVLYLLPFPIVGMAVIAPLALVYIFATGIILTVGVIIIISSGQNILRIVAGIILAFISFVAGIYVGSLQHVLFGFRRILYDR
jgi:glycosyltransferase involved in cell wall biosynthesis